MQVAKWGNSLAVRFPASLVAALNLKEGEEIELHMVGEKKFEVINKPSHEDLLSKLRQLHSPMMLRLAEPGRVVFESSM